jgi:hypothetical protein
VLNRGQNRATEGGMRLAEPTVTTSGLHADDEHAVVTAHGVSTGASQAGLLVVLETER